MSGLVATLRAIVRHEMAAVRPPELGIVTAVFPRDSESGDGNHQASVRLQASGLELQNAPVAVGRLGLSALPRVDDLVLVAFVGGDLNAPVVLGSLYDDQSHPPVAKANEVVYQPPDDEESGVRRLFVELPGGTKLTVDDETVWVEAGDTQLKIAKDGDVTLQAKGKVHLEAQGDLEIETGGKLALSAKGKVTIEGASVAIEGKSEAKLKGAKVALAGNTQFSPQ
jgi:uncharacterized protein involved in type VI secretion and phage assembly